jgi:REP element-mobilizing transposase RayT
MSQFAYKPIYRRNLPHIQPPGATLFVTFRLAGSLPKHVIDEWQSEKQMQSPQSTQNRDFQQRWLMKFESLLDNPDGSPTWLKDDRIASLISESMHFRDGKVFTLDAFSIMPTHVHMVFSPLPIEEKSDKYHSLASILHSLKGYTAQEANKIIGHEGGFWAHESYDHVVRDEGELQRIVLYIVNNPVKVGFVQSWQEWKWNYSRYDIL